MHSTPARPITDREHAKDAAWRTVVVAVAAAAFIRLLLAAAMPAFPDEAYYWDWSRRLAAGYFDHPPAVAWLIALGTTALGPTTLGIRLGTLVCALGTTLATVGTAARLGGAPAAARAALVLACMPLATLGLFLSTTDAPALCAAAVALYCLTRALERGRGLAWWAAAGASLGTGVLSKFTVGLVAAAAAAAFIARPALRARLRAPGPWLAVGISTLVSAPVWWWNAHHGWIAVRFQLSHGLGAPVRGTALGRELSLVGGQMGLVSPLLAAAIVVAIAAALRPRAAMPPDESSDARVAPLRDMTFVLGVIAASVLLFFAYSALRRPVEPNWPSPAYVAAVPLVACLRTPWLRRWLGPACALGGACILLVLVQTARPIVHLPPHRDPVDRAYGWDQLAARADAARALTAASTPRGAAVWLAADRYQDAAELALHADGTPRVFAFNLGGRPNEYDLWPSFADAARRGDALVLALDASPGGDDVARRIAPYFGSMQALERVAMTHERDTVAARRLWSFRDWRGGWPARPPLPPAKVMRSASR